MYQMLYHHICELSVILICVNTSLKRFWRDVIYFSYLKENAFHFK